MKEKRCVYLRKSSSGSRCSSYLSVTIRLAFTIYSMVTRSRTAALRPWPPCFLGEVSGLVLLVPGYRSGDKPDTSHKMGATLGFCSIATKKEKANNYHCPNSHVNVSWARQYKNASLHNQTAIVLEQISRPRPLGSDWLGFQLYFTAMNSAVGFLILILSCNGFSTGLNIQYSGTVVTLTNNTEVTAAVVRVDGVPVFSYPSITTVKKREIICQSMRQRVEGHLRDLQSFLSPVMKDFHHTEVSVQSEFACDGDDGYMKISYDNISITFHCKNEAWTPSNDHATALLNSLDTDYARNGKNILHEECSYWDKQRKVPPTASVFQEEESSPEVVCHATGFYPKTVMITWQKDGEDVHEDVDLRETLPNQDGSFQKRSILTVSAEDLQKHNYTCVIQHSSLGEEMVLHEEDIRILNPGGGSGGESGGAPIGIIVGVVAVLLVLVAVVAGIVVWKKNSGFKPVLPKPASEGDSSSNNS